MQYSRKAKQKIFDMFLEYRAAGCTFVEAYRRVCFDLMTREHKLAPNICTFRRWYKDRMTGKDRAPEKTDEHAPETETEVVVERWPEETTAEEPVPNVVLAQDEEATSSADDYTHRLELIVKLYRTRSEAACDAVCDRLLPELYADEEE